MNKYAEIYGGKVRDIKESNLDYVDFCSIFSPTSYWIDVTGVDDIDIGYIIKFTPELGTYFEAPKPIEEDTFESSRNAKLELLNGIFKEVCNNAYIDSSIGFRADANNEASRNVSGLITLLSYTPTSTIQFCDYNNSMQSLTLDQLKILEKEIIQNGSNLYQQKWIIRDKINTCTNKEELDTIDIVFTYMDFSIKNEES